MPYWLINIYIFANQFFWSKHSTKKSILQLILIKKIFSLQNKTRTPLQNSNLWLQKKLLQKAFLINYIILPKMLSGNVHLQSDFPAKVAFCNKIVFANYSHIPLGSFLYRVILCQNTFTNGPGLTEPNLRTRTDGPGPISTIL